MVHFEFEKLQIEGIPEGTSVLNFAPFLFASSNSGLLTEQETYYYHLNLLHVVRKFWSTSGWRNVPIVRQ